MEVVLLMVKGLADRTALQALRGEFLIVLLGLVVTIPGIGAQVALGDGLAWPRVRRGRASLAFWTAHNKMMV
eukprot:3110939-Pyramimonas_sp.AAC.1